MSERFPESIAIAGAWGYIGRKFLEAAQQLQLQTTVFDPGPVPSDLDLSGITQLKSEAEFYRQPADLFHLALHPEHRAFGMELLLPRIRRERLLILCEKPMAAPADPDQCRRSVAAGMQSGGVVLYDFPELFDPLTARILEFLAGFRELLIESLDVERSKDREDPANPRNYKRMVTIQYQESVHCLAFVLWILGAVKGSVAAALADGLSVTASAEAYAPPNPEAYPHAVDGKCEYQLTLGGVTVTGRTNFQRGAKWSKRRVLRGRGDGRPFEIEADYLEGRKYLLLDGQPQTDVVHTDSYAEVLKTCGRWYRQHSAAHLMNGLFPNPAFAHTTYQLSSLLWRSSRQRQTIALDSLGSLLDFDANYTPAEA